MEDTPRYWFKAKRYGWGWGLPVTWEGWVALVAFVAGFAVVPVILRGAAAVIAAALVLVAFVTIAARKGEPPRWRWGSRD